MSKPEFIFVPGAWYVELSEPVHPDPGNVPAATYTYRYESNSPKVLLRHALHGPECFHLVTSILEERGFVVHGVNLPSVGAQPALKSFIPDVEAIKATVNKVLSSGKDVVVMCHSYGGIVGSEALADYLKDDKQPGWGTVKRLVYVCSFAVPEGMSVRAVFGFRSPPWHLISEDGTEVRPSDPAKIFYNDISPEAAEVYVSQLRVHSYLTFASQTTVAPWKSIPSTYVLCEKDAAIAFATQEAMVAAAQAAAPDSFDVVERCDAGHSPFISQPEWLAEKLVEAAAVA